MVKPTGEKRPRRTYGTGAVTYRPDRDRWVGAYEVHDGSGRRRRKSVSAKTEAEAIRALQKARSTSAAQLLIDERVTLGTYLDRWLVDVVAPSVRPVTLANYTSMVRHHLAPGLGGVKLARLAAPEIQRYLNAKLAGGLSPQTVAHHLACLRTALNQAVRWRLIPRNEATDATPPHITRADRLPLDIDQIRTFLAHVDGDPWQAIYSLALTCGMRQSEILGLRWQHVDLDAGELDVDKVLVRIHGHSYLDDPKNKSSRRRVVLPAVAWAALRNRKTGQARDRLANGKAWIDHDLVFTTPTGDPLHRDVVTRAFQKHLAAAGLPKQRFHDTRHAVVTVLHGGGSGLSLEAIGSSIGHSRPSETADRYAHLIGDASRNAAETMDQMLDAPTKRKKAT